MKNFNVIIYQYQHEKFIDFNSLLYICSQKNHESSVRSKVWRHLIRNRYTTVSYNNKKLYSLQQIINDTQLVFMMQRAEELLNAIQED